MNKVLKSLKEQDTTVPDWWDIWTAENKQWFTHYQLGYMACTIDYFRSSLSLSMEELRGELLRVVESMLIVNQRDRDKKPMQDREYLREMAKAVDEKLPDNHGFMLFAFEYDNPTARLFYTASCSRPDGIKMVKTWLYHQGERENWMEHVK